MQPDELATRLLMHVEPGPAATALTAIAGEHRLLPYGPSLKGLTARQVVRLILESPTRQSDLVRQVARPDVIERLTEQVLDLQPPARWALAQRTLVGIDDADVYHRKLLKQLAGVDWSAAIQAGRHGLQPEMVDLFDRHGLDPDGSDQPWDSRDTGALVGVLLAYDGDDQKVAAWLHGQMRAAPQATAEALRAGGHDLGRLPLDVLVDVCRHLPGGSGMDATVAAIAASERGDPLPTDLETLVYAADRLESSTRPPAFGPTVVRLMEAGRTSELRRAADRADAPGHGISRAVAWAVAHHTRLPIDGDVVALLLVGAAATSSVSRFEHLPDVLVDEATWPRLTDGAVDMLAASGTDAGRGLAALIRNDDTVRAELFAARSSVIPDLQPTAAETVALIETMDGTRRDVELAERTAETHPHPLPDAVADALVATGLEQLVRTLEPVDWTDARVETWRSHWKEPQGIRRVSRAVLASGRVSVETRSVVALLTSTLEISDLVHLAGGRLTPEQIRAVHTADPTRTERLLAANTHELVSTASADALAQVLPARCFSAAPGLLAGVLHRTVGDDGAAWSSVVTMLDGCDLTLTELIDMVSAVSRQAA